MCSTNEQFSYQKEALPLKLIKKIFNYKIKDISIIMQYS